MQKIGDLVEGPLPLRDTHSWPAAGSTVALRQTFGSILGGYGSPVMMTARPLLLAKSNPSLTYQITQSIVEQNL